MSDLVLTDRFVLFWNGWPSQWHPSPFEIEGLRYTCAEQFMMAEKARSFDDPDTERRIMASDHPRAQKKLGRQVRGFNQQVWESLCLGIVFRANVAKFTANPDLRAMLLATAGKRMVEASPLDQVWGIGLAPDDPLARDESNWRGTNWLGLVLDHVRDHLQNGRGLEAVCRDPNIAAQLARRDAMRK